MFKMFMSLIMATMFVFMFNNAKACDAEGIFGTELYRSQCPFGDAVIVNKEEKEFLGKEVGIIVDCVVWSNDRQAWLTKNYDTVNEKWEKTVIYPDNEYEVWTMDGQLKHNSKGDVIIEISYCDDPTKVDEWLAENKRK